MDRFLPEPNLNKRWDFHHTSDGHENDGVDDNYERNV